MKKTGMKKSLENIGMFLAISSLIIAVLTWLFPFNPIGNSPFIGNTPDTIAPNITVEKPSPASTPIEMKNTTSLLFFEDFEDDEPTMLSHSGGVWNVSIENADNLVYGIENDSQYSGFRFGLINWSDYSVYLRIKFPQITPFSKVLLGFRESFNGVQAYLFDIKPYDNEVILGVVNQGEWNKITSKELNFKRDVWYLVHVEVEKANIRVYIDELLVIQESDPNIKSGLVSFGVEPGTFVQIDDIRVTEIEN